jgi:sugar/nucleoside kinase (ribokinase family)
MNQLDHQEWLFKGNTMTKYHIYGLGNALVDIEIEVTESELTQLGIDKGVMTLVDEERQQYLLSALPGTHHNRACGGSAANTVIGAAKLGARCFYSCKIANDETGDFYMADLQREGVDSNLRHQQREDGHTGQCLVMITPDADRTMNTYLGVTGNLSYQEIDESALQESLWLYVEGYLVSSEPAREAAIKAMSFAREKGVKVALSLSDPAMVQFFTDGLKQMVGEGVDLLFCNQDEALRFTGSSSLDDAFERLKSYAKQFAITRGSEGASVWDGQSRLEIAPFSVKAVDTNGAGDLFAGAFLYAMTHNMSFKQAGKLASFASSVLVTEFGPRLSEQGEQKVRDFLEQLKS